ncbi:unnamed protein product [Rotaria socialis]|uniref:Uncharacterized protein n=1 Tax=Rotaria socialis TaxID=392032 RepID=A0A817SPE8_9BILA|nr:unnamed protein product [Rotaria socialis]
MEHTFLGGLSCALLKLFSVGGVDNFVNNYDLSKLINKRFCQLEYYEDSQKAIIIIFFTFKENSFMNYEQYHICALQVVFFYDHLIV